MRATRMRSKETPWQVELETAGANGTRLVPASFGRREPHPDPAWEREFAATLRDSHSRPELMDLFARFRSGDSVFDRRMRRVLMHALCKRAGDDLQVGPDVVLTHPETMEFGDCVFIGAQTVLQGRFDGTCQIGNRVWIGPQSYFDARHLILEDYVGWGPGAKVLGSSHTGIPLSDPVIATELLIRPVAVRTGADIGMNASILPGVTIGAHSIIGAGAVVTHDVPEYTIAAGVPARTIRKRQKSTGE